MNLQEAVAQLRRWGPAKLRVQLDDGNWRDVAISNRRNKWSALKKTLEGMPWARIEADDAKGALVGAVEGEVQEYEYDDQGDGDDRDMAKFERLAKVLIQAQDVALKRQREHDGGMQAANAELLKTLTERLVSLEKSFASMLQRTAEATLAGAATADGGMLSEEMLGELFPDILRLLQMRSAMANANAAKAAGGVNGGNPA